MDAATVYSVPASMTLGANKPTTGFRRLRAAINCLLVQIEALSFSTRYYCFFMPLDLIDFSSIIYES